MLAVPHLEVFCSFSYLLCFVLLSSTFVFTIYYFTLFFPFCQGLHKGFNLSFPARSGQLFRFVSLLFISKVCNAILLFSLLDLASWLVCDLACGLAWRFCVWVVWVWLALAFSLPIYFSSLLWVVLSLLCDAYKLALTADSSLAHKLGCVDWLTGLGVYATISCTPLTRACGALLYGYDWRNWLFGLFWAIRRVKWVLSFLVVIF